MQVKLVGAAAFVMAGCMSFTSAGQLHAQCCQSNRSPQGNMLQRYLQQQQYSLQQLAMQQLAMQQRNAQLALQQANQRQQQPANQAVLKNNAKAPKAAKQPVPTVEKQNDPVPAEVELVSADPETMASASLKFVQSLVSDPTRRTFARLQLQQIIEKYPNTTAAGDAQNMLTRLR
jgi:TolA-binding protein